MNAHQRRKSRRSGVLSRQRFVMPSAKSMLATMVRLSRELGPSPQQLAEDRLTAIVGEYARERWGGRS